MKKKLLSLLLALVMAATMLPVTAMASTAYYINGKTVRYDDFASSPNECWVYANNIYNKIWGQQFTNSFSDTNNSLRNLSDNALTLTAAHLKAYVSNAKLGAVLRICNSEYLHGSDGWGHSQIIVQKDSNGFTVFEGGLSSSPYCREKYYTWSGYLSSYSYAYIKYIKWPGASAYVDSHTCDRGSYQYYESVHPHYKCYKCSICGKIWRDTSAPTKLTDCEQCYPRTTTITYYGSDGSVWATDSGTADKSYTLNTDYPRKDGSYFVGWSYTANTDSFDLRPGDTVTIKGSIDLYPVYVTHEQAVSGDPVYIYNIDDFDDSGYDISSLQDTVQTRLDDSGWSSWSDYSLTAATESSTKQVKTATMYRYYYFQCPSCGAHEPFTGKSDCGATITGSNWHEKWFTTPYSSSNYSKFSYTTSKYYTTSLGDGQRWIFSAGNLNNTTPGTKDATGSEVVISTGYSTRQWVTKYKTVSRTFTAYQITKQAEALAYCGDNLTWTLNDQGILTISGTGDMWDYNSRGVPWYDRCEEIKAVSLPDGMTSIGARAFEDCKALTNVVIPDSVTSIGEMAFADCSSLNSVSIGRNVETIQWSTFDKCEELTCITVASGNSNYMSRDGVLFDKSGDTLLICPQGKVGDYRIPDGVNCIERKAFYDCSRLSRVVIPNGVTSIEDLAFCGCKNLRVVTIPDSVTSIGGYAFAGCESLTTVTIPNGVTRINNCTFGGCIGLATINIPDSVTVIGWSVFSACNALTDVYYDGTEAQWKQIEIDNGNDANKCLNGATIHFAQPEPQPPAEVSGTIAVTNGRAHPGGKVTVQVVVTENLGISNMRLQLSYPEGFTLESIQRENALSSLTFTPPGKLTANSVNLVFDGLDADTETGTILTLTFSVAETVEDGDYVVRLGYLKGDVLDGDLEDIDLSLQDGTISVASFLYGDVNGDGEITMKDLGVLRRYLAGGYSTESFVEAAADLNGDGVVNMKDLGVLRRYLAGGYDIKLGK